MEESFNTPPPIGPEATQPKPKAQVYYNGNPKPSRVKYWALGCGSGCLLALLFPFMFVVGLAMMIGNSVSSSITSSDPIVTKIPESNSRIALSGNSNSDIFIAKIKLNGPIMLDNEEESFFDTDFSSANYALKQIKKATDDPICNGIILDLSTPGGGVTDSDIIWKALKDFRAAKPNRKVVVLMGDTVASGGYYISTAADYIFAHPTTMTGSIGVIISSINATELAQKIGIAPVTIKSGKTKDFLNPLRPLAPEEEAMLQAMVDKLNNRFIKLLVDGRNLDEAKVRAIADGRVMLAEEAKEHG
ncbi:MAG: signal peptide peptidase SppA, partial [Kiritimatiellae bacterium]|nr:signal peptide peptidase SppA [Kiritimatiellia bacterium]